MLYFLVYLFSCYAIKVKLLGLFIKVTMYDDKKIRKSFIFTFELLFMLSFSLLNYFLL